MNILLTVVNHRHLVQWSSEQYLNLSHGRHSRHSHDHPNIESQWKWDVAHRITLLTESTSKYIYGCFLKQGYPQIIHFTRFSLINHPFRLRRLQCALGSTSCQPPFRPESSGFVKGESEGNQGLRADQQLDQQLDVTQQSCTLNIHRISLFVREALNQHA